MRTASVLLITLMLTACGWTSDHWSSPSYIPDGKESSPPRFVRIIEWKRPNWFWGEYIQNGKWRQEGFVLLRREEGPVYGEPTWHLPDWVGTHQPREFELTKEERKALEKIAREYPVDCIVEVEYPLMEERYKDDIGHGTDVRVPRENLSIYEGYLANIRKRVRNAILIPAHER